FWEFAIAAQPKNSCSTRLIAIIADMTTAFSPEEKYLLFFLANELHTNITLAARIPIFKPDPLLISKALRRKPAPIRRAGYIARNRRITLVMLKTTTPCMANAENKRPPWSAA